MAWQVSVDIIYDVPGESVERSTGFTLEIDQPPTLDIIANEVDAVAEELVNPRFSPVPGEPQLPLSYRFEVTSVFEL